MSLAIFDIDDNPIASFMLSIDSLDVQILTLRIECRTGQNLRGIPVSDVVVEAKRSVDSTWVDIETTPIDLTPYNPTRQNFDIRITAGTVASLKHHNFNLTVGP